MKERFARSKEPEHLGDVVAYAVRRRGRKSRHHGALGQRVDEVGDREIGGPEILAPLGYAVRLIDRDQGQAQSTGLGQALGEFDESRIGQTLGRHVHDLIPTL